MSFRDLRNFTEQMRALGYNRNISIENFRDPNFELVADILFWFAQRYDPKMDISDDIEDEKDRIMFIRSVCQLFANKARIQLNPKKLYEASGYAVKELLKISNMMHKAMKSSGDVMAEDDESNNTLMDLNQSSKLHNLKAARQLATEITESGAKLYDLLGQEKELRDAREKATEFLDSISRNLDSNSETVHIERTIQEIIDGQGSKMKDMEDSMKQLRLDEAELQNKLQRRKQEYERAEKRLKGIENVKPEYQEEYERLEYELERFYNVYVEKFTNIDFLEHELDLFNNKNEQRRLKQNDVIEKFKSQQKKQDQDELLNDEREEDLFQENQDQMRNTKGNGFGGNYGGQARGMGGLQPESDDDEGAEEPSSEEDENPQQEEDEEESGSDHNF